MKAITVGAIALLAITTAACAGRASSVAPVAVSSLDYAAMDCPTARAALETTRARVNSLSRSQNNAAVADAASMALLFVPLGSVFGGDKSGELAQAKGEQIALERHITMRCGA